MGEGIGPQRGRGLKKKRDHSLNDLKIVPAANGSNTAVAQSSQPALQNEQVISLEEELGDTSFEFGLKSKYERLRTEHRKETIGTARERKSELKQLKKLTNAQNTEAGEEQEFYAHRDSDTILDKLMNWFADQLKKLETLVLSCFGVKSDEELELEEELEELQRQGESAKLKKNTDDEDEEDELAPPAPAARKF